MPLTTYRALVTIPMDTNLPEDVITNSWHFADLNAIRTRAASATLVCHHLRDFYQAIDQDVLSSLVGPTAKVKVYDLNDITPRVPLATEDIDLTPGTGNPLPAQVALCLSYRAPLISGIAAARRRGRIFLGPLRDPVVTVVNGHHQVTAGVSASLIAAATGLKNNSGTDQLPWSVYSPTRDAQGDTLDQATDDVTAGWIDNALDTVRARKSAATARTTF